MNVRCKFSIVVCRSCDCIGDVLYSHEGAVFSFSLTINTFLNNCIITGNPQGSILLKLRLSCRVNMIGEYQKMHTYKEPGEDINFKSCE